MESLETVASTAEPAFASNAEGRIVAWNEGAERMLGHTSRDALGKHCRDLLDGRDVFGNRFCDEHCAFRNMVNRHEPVCHCRLNFCTASSDRIMAMVSVFVVFERQSADYSIVHLLEPGEDSPGERAPSNSSEVRRSTDRPAERVVELTARETEVLRMLAGGASTAAVADHLRISESTIRNHIHHALKKLDAHSRLEAVSLAVRRRLL